MRPYQNSIWLTVPQRLELEERRCLGWGGSYGSRLSEDPRLAQRVGFEETESAQLGAAWSESRGSRRRGKGLTREVKVRLGRVLSEEVPVSIGGEEKRKGVRRNGWCFRFNVAVRFPIDSVGLGDLVQV